MQTLERRPATVDFLFAKFRFLRLYYKWILLVISIVFLTSCANGVGLSSAKPKAEEGLLDLSGWSFADQGSVKLEGEWSFYWKRLLRPDELGGPNAPPPTAFMTIPRSWKGFSVDGRPLEASGFATFRLQVKLPGADGRYALKLPPIATSYRLWVDGQLAAESGRVGTSADESTPKYRTGVYLFTPIGQTVDLTLQVANYEHRRAGIWTDITLGRDRAVADSYFRSTAVEMIIVGCLLMIGFHHLGLYLLRREERAPLYFGLYCMLSALRSVVVGNVVISRLVPSLTWTFSIRLEYLASYIGLPLFYSFIGRLYPEEMNPKFRRAMMTATVVLSLVVLAAKPEFFTRTLWIAQLLLLFAIAHIYTVLVRALRNRREGAVLACIGAAVYAVAVINDMLYYNGLVRTGDFSAYGLLFFVIMQAFIMSSKSAKAFQAEAVMSNQLKELNSGLEAKINERTDALEQSYSRLEVIHAELARMETSRRRLLSDISHDLGTPMTLIQGYIEALLDDVAETPEQQRKYLSLIHSRVLGLNRLIADLFELSKLEARQIGFHFQQMDVDEFIASLNNRYELEIEGAGLHYKLDVEGFADGGRERFLRIDLDRINQVFTNIIYNAVKHTPPGGNVELRFSRTADRRLKAEIADSGSGIDPEDIPFIFDRFYKKDKSRNTAVGGSGLGLAIAKEIIEFHGGEIGVTSSPMAGSTFYFLLPLYGKDDR
jgi:signal transduction histidine kinase